jgi:c(7)-type cytochrome triheme protein
MTVAARMEVMSASRSPLAITALLGLFLAVASWAASESSTDVRLPADVTYRAAETSPGPVVFSHTMHVAFAENRCLGCHPEPFSILRPAGRITHEEMDSGRKCGVCHDGKAAHGTQEGCDSCHGSGDGS